MSIHHLHDLGFTVVADPHEYNVEFKAHPIMGYEKEWGVGDPFWESEDAAGCVVPAYTLEDADVFLSGSIKRDGCSDWESPSLSENGPLHVCGRDHAEKIGKLLLWLFDHAKQELGEAP